jgi:hypothetical protein
MKKANDAAQPLRAEVVNARLRELAERSQKVSTAANPIDMSASAVIARLRDCAEISALVWALAPDRSYRI